MKPVTLSFEKLMDRVTVAPSPDPAEDLTDLREAFHLRAGRVRLAEVSRFADLVAPLLRQVPMIQRMAFACQLASNRAVPKSLLLQIAGDHYMVSAPMLEHAPMLEEGDLVQLMTQRGEDIMLAIAKRRNISVQVTDLLMEKGGAKVIAALVANLTARISRRNMSLLADLSKSQPDLAAALRRRNDLPDVVAAELAKRSLKPVPVAAAEEAPAPAPATQQPGAGQAAAARDRAPQPKSARVHKEPKVFRYS